MSRKMKTTEEAKHTLVPKLRFPEFWKAGEWTTEELGRIAEISTEKVGTSAHHPPHSPR